MTNESIVLQQNGVFRWDGPKRKQTVIKAKLGNLVLTNERLLFLSTGKNDLTVGKLVAGGMSPGIGGLGTSDTSGLDLSALSVEGGMEIPVAQLRSAELKGLFKALTITWVDGSGTQQAATFAPKNGGMPDGGSWVAEIERGASGGSS